LTASRTPAPELVGLVEIGRLTRPHGVRGEVRVHLHFAGSETLEHVDSVTLVRGGVTLGERRVLSARRADKAALLRLEGVADRDAAETLRGAGVCVPRAALPPLDDGEYYLSDLVGARVVAPGGPVGEVVEVRVHPSVDSLIVRTPDGRLLEQAITEPWVARVDVKERLVELSSTDGLI
jgi:16S rRNA processing protein RimM